MGVNVGSVFSGIGGLDEGLRRAGHRHVFFCESDPYRRDVLRARFPGVPVFDDVRHVHRERLVGRDGVVAADESWGRQAEHAAVDLLCGGFPCQDLSVAGRRAGLQAEERSSLFFEFARIAETFRPRWLLVENVPGLLSSQDGRDFGCVLETLADIGYGVAWRVLDSRFFGVPQRRRRVFIIGALADGDPRAAAERAGEVLAIGSRCKRHPATRGEAGPDVTVASLSGLGSGGPDDNDGQANRVIAVSSITGATLDVLPTLDKGAEDGPRRNQDAPMVVAAPLTKGSATGQGVNPPGRLPAVAFHVTQDPISGDQSPAMGKGNSQGCATIGALTSTGVRRLTPTECERLQGLPDGWTQIGGTPDSRRYSALGDAVTANVSEWIGGQFV